VVVVAIAVVGYLGSRWAFYRAYAQLGIQVRPYIAQIENYSVVEGREVLVTRRTEVRRRDGAVHKSGTMYRPDGTPIGTIRRVDFPDGVVGMMVDELKAKATGRLSPRRVAARKLHLLNPPPNCAWKGHTVDGEEILFGHRAVRLIMQPGSDSLWRAITWAFPDFNCVTLQVVRQERAGVGADWRTTGGLRLISFAAIDPEEGVFSNWSRYEEMKPSELKRRAALHAGLTPQSCPACFAGDPSDRGYDLANSR
jgi:hypothetical protein